MADIGFSSDEHLKGTLMTLSEQILGTGRLASFEGVDVDTSEKRYPLGPGAEGFIMYLEDGYMSAQIMDPGRPAHPDPANDGPEQEVAGIAQGYLAYAGPFSVDESAEVIHHEVVVSLVPAWLGKVQLRDAALKDGRLILAANTEFAGRTTRSTLVWQRP